MSTTKKVVWAVGLVIGALVVLVNVLAATAPYHFPHPASKEKFIYKDGAILWEKYVQQQERRQEAARLAAANPGRPPHEVRVPKAVAVRPRHDFGVMDPLTMGQHTFVIRNDGDAPLQLTQGPTTCKCTLSRVAEQPIPPGESGEIRLEWNSGRDKKLFSHGATIHTNDPQNKEIQLRIEGMVRELLAMRPSSLSFDHVGSEANRSKTFDIYSQHWDSFQLAQVTCSLEGVTWEIEPLDQETLASDEAKAGYRLRVTVPDDLPRGEFHHWLHLNIHPHGQEAAAETFDYPLKGRVRGQLTYYGQDVGVDGRLRLGVIRQWVGAASHLLIKVRDAEPVLHVTSVTSLPDFVEVSLTPSDRTAGLHNLRVEIPKDAPLCAHQGIRSGSIVIETDHPRIDRITIPLEFSVVGRRPGEEFD